MWLLGLLWLLELLGLQGLLRLRFLFVGDGSISLCIGCVFVCLGRILGVLGVLGFLGF